MVEVMRRDRGPVGRMAGQAAGFLALGLWLTACMATAPGGGGGPAATGGAYVIGAPYSQGGVTFTPEERFEYQATGPATVITAGSAGARTANGDAFDPDALSAVHHTLQMPSFVRVTNLDNQRSLVLLVNDRGPADPGILIGVTERAAELLGFGGGRAENVRVEVLAEPSRAIARLSGRTEAALVADASADQVAVSVAPVGPVAVDSAPAEPPPVSAPRPDPEPVDEPVAPAPPAAPPAVAPDPVETEATAPTDLPDIAEPDVAEPDIPEPDAVEPVVARPDVPERSVAEPGGTAADDAVPADATETSGSPAVAAPAAVAGTPPSRTVLAETDYEARAIAEARRLAAARGDAEGDNASRSAAGLSTISDYRSPGDPLALADARAAAQARAVAEARGAALVHPLETEPLDTTTPGPERAFYVQAGAFTDRDNAERLQERLSAEGDSQISPTDVGGRTFYRVWLGPYTSAGDATAAMQRVLDAGVASEARVVVN